MSIIRFNNEAAGHSIMSGTGGVFVPGLHTVISRHVNGWLTGGIVYTDHQRGGSCQMHQWGGSKHWGSRDMLYVSFHYPFVQLNYKSVLGCIRAKNTAAIAINEKYGFKVIAKVPYVYPGDDMVVMQMLRKNCRWLDLKPRTLIYNGVD